VRDRYGGVLALSMEPRFRARCYNMVERIASLARARSGGVIDREMVGLSEDGVPLPTIHAEDDLVFRRR
jgi:hypothetical protein